jgi:hypothetical protein
MSEPATLAVHQPNYAPWCGYFAKMRHCNVFVFLDDAQMPGGQSYVYRTKIRNGDGDKWLSIPNRSRLGEPIREVRFADAKWTSKHVNALRAVYGRCPCFKEVFPSLEPLYLDPGESLAAFNQAMIRTIADYLGMMCRFEVSSQLGPSGTGDDRLIGLARMLGAGVYLSGKGGQNYQDPAKFATAGVELAVRPYVPVAYPQIHGEFVPGLSILDALFHLGKRTNDLLEYRAAEPMQSFAAENEL